MANVDELDWDESAPALSDPRKDGALEIRALRQAVGYRLDKEHVVSADSVGGEHLQGSAKAYFNGTTPTDRPGLPTTALDSSDNGRLWLDSGVLKYYDDPSWVIVGFGEPESYGTNIFSSVDSAGGWTNSTGKIAAVTIIYYRQQLTINGDYFVEVEDSSSVFRTVAKNISTPEVGGGIFQSIIQTTVFVPPGKAVRLNPLPPLGTQEYAFYQTFGT